MALKGQTLACLGRQSYVSKRGLSGVLSELKDLGILSDDVVASRQSVKRAREEFLVGLESIHGALIKSMEIPLEEDKAQTLTVYYIDPVAYLNTAVDHCAPFRDLIAKCKPPSLQEPWRLIAYSDEVSPGNQLRHLQKRKFQVLYYSFAEYGMKGLGNEHLWLTLCAVRSLEVTKIGGLTVLWKHMMNAFFGGSPSFSTGVPLGAANLVMVCHLSIIISDESAIKHTFEMKGAAGTLNCGLCRNCVTRGLEDHDSDDWLVSYTCSDFSKFVPHTNNSVIAIIQHLQAQESVLSKAAFDKLEQSLGYNLIQDGLLLHPTLGHKVLSTVPRRN